MNLVICPLGIEAWAIRRGLGSLGGQGRTPTEVIRCGMGPTKAAETARRLAGAGAGAVWVMGVAGAVKEGLRPGDVVVADRVVDQRSGAEMRLEGFVAVASALSDAGLRVHTGPLLTVPRLVHSSREREALARSGVLAVDMESYPLVTAGWQCPVVAVRPISDSPGHGLLSPRVLTGGMAALRSLKQCAGATMTV